MHSEGMQRVLFLFRRDLRIEDNTGLLFACRNAKEVVLGFIFTPEQVENNPYRSDRCLQFMLESLEELEGEIEAKGGKLYLFYGTPEEVVSRCIAKLSIDGVVVNRDYTPYSIQRDEKIRKVCCEHSVPFYSLDDALLNAPEDTLKSNGEPYTIFTPFFRNASQIPVKPPVKNRYNNYFSGNIPFAQKKSLYKKILPKRQPQQPGGRRSALKILSSLGQFSKYPSQRDIPAVEGTTHLSPHLKFTTCSPREVYQSVAGELGPHSELIRSLYWRDFFTTIAFFFPHIFQGAFREKYDRIQWSYDESVFKSWCEGNTGFPIIDAGMREMNETGFMHNRVRMITASFLIKDLHIDWRWGERYFAQRLIDYDPAVNNGNWQWCASTGCDAQPYFRIFNPWAQAAKFDPDCVYIKRWVPELSQLPSKVIHKWHMQDHTLCPGYPAPMVDHAVECKLALTAFQKINI